MHIIAIIPVLNEEGAIGPTLDRIPKTQIRHIIVVDGGSTDNTRQEATAHGAEIITEPRKGYGRACLTGAERAAALGAEILLFMDGDGADAVEHAQQLITPIEQNQADFVLATRTRGPRQPGSMGLHQILAGELIGLVLRAATGTRYSDMCAFRALRTQDLFKLDMREMTYGWNLEMQIRAPRAGLRVREIPLPYYRRVAGASKVAGNLPGTIRAGARILGTLIKVAFLEQNVKPTLGP